MSRQIRVDPPKLGFFAKDLRRIALECRTGGDHLLAQTSGALSYDGQYAPWIQAIAGEADHRLRLFGDKLDSLADLLDRIAWAFENADSLDEREMHFWAGEYRALIDAGFDGSTFPWWLIRGQKPPWMSDSVWKHMLPEDRDAYLASLGGSWPEFASSGDYSHATDDDTWSAFLAWLYVQGQIASPPDEGVWRSAARAAGKTLEEYLSEISNTPQAQVDAWFRAAEAHGFHQESAIHEIAAMARAGETVEEYFGFSMEGDWQEEDKNTVVESVLQVSHAMAEITGGSAHEALGLVYDVSADDPLVFGWENCPECNGLGGYTYGRNLIRFESLSPISELRRTNNVVHELGHAFHWAMVHAGVEPDPYSMLEITQNSDPSFPNRLAPPSDRWARGPNYGFASPQKVYTWQQSALEIVREEFADQFLGWTFDEWESDEFGLTEKGQLRSDWMDQNMPIWVKAVASH